MDATSNLSLPFIVAAQAQKHVTHNEALRALDAVVQLAVLDRDLAAPPALPAEGARYIVGESPTGAWTGHAGSIAAFQDGTWAFFAPEEGWRAWVADEGRLYVRSGSAWSLLPLEDVDYKLAENILRLRPIWYRSKCPNDNPVWSWYGLLAEEVATVEPRLATWGYTEEDLEIVEREADGRIVSERVLKRDARLVPDGVAYDRLTVLLLTIVRRQEARVQALERIHGDDDARCHSRLAKT